MAFPFDLAVTEWGAGPATGNYRIQDVFPTNPGGTQAFIIDSWSDGCFDYINKDILIWNGGHNDYAGNEVYAYSINPLSGNFLQWRRKSAPSTRSDGTNVESYSNGTPSAKHTYCTLLFRASSSKMLVMPGGFNWGSTGGFTSKTWAFDLTNETPNSAAPGAWTELATPSSFPQSDGPYPQWILDVDQDLAFGFMVKGLMEYNCASNTFTNRTSFEANFVDTRGTSIWIPGSPSLMMSMGNGTTQVRRLDNWAYIGAESAWGMTGDTDIEDAIAPGIGYCDNDGNVYGWAADGASRRDYYQIVPGTKVSTLITGTGDVPDTPPTNGIYRKWLHVGDGLFAVVNSTASPVYFVRVAASAAPAGQPAVRRYGMIDAVAKSRQVEIGRQGIHIAKAPKGYSFSKGLFIPKAA